MKERKNKNNFFFDVEPNPLWIYNNKKLDLEWVQNDPDTLNEELKYKKHAFIKKP